VQMGLTLDIKELKSILPLCTTLLIPEWARGG